MPRSAVRSGGREARIKARTTAAPVYLPAVDRRVGPIDLLGPEGVAKIHKAAMKILGEIGIGTNAGIDRPTGSILLDEKMAGTVHLALGRSYPETGGRNSSALHWDLICDLRAGGRLTADGEAIEPTGA